MKEIFKDIKGYEGFYQVSNLGRVKRIASYVKHNGVFGKDKIKVVIEKILTPVNLKGYEAVKLSKNGVYHRFYVHRLVAEAFIPNPENKPEINHKRGIKTDNRVSELEWATHQENCKHRDDNNLRKPPKGEKHYLYGKHIKIGTFKSKKEIEKTKNTLEREEK